MRKFFQLLSIIAFLFFLTACGTAESSGNSDDNDKTNKDSESIEGLPDQLVFSVYSVGSGTYNDVAGIADVLTAEYGTQIRLIPSDTGIGRVAPLKEGSADFARIGEEYFYAFEGDLDFATKEWGPQDIQLVWAPLAPLGLAVKEDSGITEPKDLKGKKVPHLLANPSVNNKIEAYLAYGGLTWDDVEEIQVSYSDQAEAFKSGQIDAIFFNVYASPMYELESVVDYVWIDLVDDSPETLERVAEVAPTASISTISNAAGTEDGETFQGIVYAVPIVTYGDKSVEEVYALVKALDEQYENYQDITISLRDSSLDDVLKEPLVAPFHAGSVKYFKEKGLWSDEADQRNQELVERQQQLQALWEKFIENAADDNVHDEWNQFKEENLK